jgi:hypothetical protein
MVTGYENTHTPYSTALLEKLNSYSDIKIIPMIGCNFSQQPDITHALG